MIEQALSSMGNAVETGVELGEDLCRLSKRFHSFQRIFHCEVVVVQGISGWFVEQWNICLSQADAPLDILPAVERNILTERDILCNWPWDADVTCVREAVLDFWWKRFSCVLCDFPISKLPSCSLEPAHDGRDRDCGIPGDVAENIEWGMKNWFGFARVSADMSLTRVRCKENIIADEEDDVPARFFHSAIPCDPLLCFWNCEAGEREGPMET